MNETPTEPKPIKLSLDDEEESIRRAVLADKCGVPSQYILITTDELRVLYSAHRTQPTPPPEAAGETAPETIRRLNEELYVAERDLGNTKRLLDGEANIRLRLVAERDALTSKLAEMTKERDGLLSALDMGQRNCDDVYNDLKKERDIAKSKAVIAERALTAKTLEADGLRGALIFYADLKNYAWSGWQGDPIPAPIQVDGGDKARRAFRR